MTSGVSVPKKNKTKKKKEEKLRLIMAPSALFHVAFFQVLKEKTGCCSMEDFPLPTLPSKAGFWRAFAFLIHWVCGGTHSFNLHTFLSSYFDRHHLPFFTVLICVQSILLQCTFFTLKSILLKVLPSKSKFENVVYYFGKHTCNYCS